MKRTSVLIFGLLFSAVVMTSMALRPQTVTAGLYCSQLKGCGGDAGCSNSGSANGCDITCSDQTIVTCPKGSDDDLSD